MSRHCSSPLYKTVLLVFISMLPSMAAAGDGIMESPAPLSFYEDQKRGYYWYEDPAFIEDEEQKEKAEFEESSLPSYTYEELWNLHPDQFQKYREEATKKAVQFPTIENVKHHLFIQDVARRKSLAFASVVGLVGQLHPELSTEDSYPMSAPGRRALSDKKLSEFNDILIRSKNDFALLVFNQSGCNFCEAQAPIVQRFEAAYGWSVKNIDIEVFADLALRFNVEQTPAIIVVSRNSGESMPISSGIIDLSTIKERVVRAIRFLKGEVDPQQYYLKDFQKGTGMDPLKFLQNIKPGQPLLTKAETYE